MEEKMMKDFDRNIERALSDYSVAPPFGVWNRIQSELDAAEPAPVVAAPLIPRGVLAGFFAGAALIGTLVGGWFMYNNSGTPVQQAPATAIETKTEQSAPVITTQSVQQNNTTTLVAANPVSKNNSVKAQVTENTKPEIKAEANGGFTEQPVAGVTALNNTTTQQVSETTAEAYYFPPVDINTPEEHNEEVVADLYRGYNTPNIGEQKPAEAKKKSSSSDSHMKFKKKRKPRGGFSYGRLNRLKPGSR